VESGSHAAAGSSPSAPPGAFEDDFPTVDLPGGPPNTHTERTRPQATPPARIEREESRDAQPAAKPGRKLARKAAKKLKDMLGLGRFERSEQSETARAEANTPRPEPKREESPRSQPTNPMPRVEPREPAAPARFDETRDEDAREDAREDDRVVKSANPPRMRSSLEAALASLTAADATPVGPEAERASSPDSNDTREVAREDAGVTPERSRPNPLPALESFVPSDFLDEFRHSLDDSTEDVASAMPPADRAEPAPAGPSTASPGQGVPDFIESPAEVFRHIFNVDNPYVAARKADDVAREQREMRLVPPAYELPSLPDDLPGPPRKDPAPLAEVPVPESAPEMQSPAARTLLALASEVTRLRVPEGHRARARARLLDLARQMDQREPTWEELRDAVAFAMEFPGLALRIVPLLLPYFDDAA
jgi:hypothetical protein